MYRTAAEREPGPRWWQEWPRLRSAAASAWEERWDLLGTAALVALCILSLYALGKFLTSSGRPEFCYLATRCTAGDNADRVSLCASIDWRDDNKIAAFDTVDQAIDAAKKIGCDLRP